MSRTLFDIVAGSLLACVAAGGAGANGVQLVRLRVPGGQLQAYIAPAHGADLAGLEVRHDGRWSELLYRGMDYRPTDGWTGKAPILWPAVGRNFPYPAGAGGHGNGLGWVLHGRVYPIPIHGFARDQAWQIVRRGTCSGSAFLTLTLRDDKQTRGMYPFGFALTTEYRIWRDALYIRQAVHADRANHEPMPFSIGNHITFTIPLLPGDDPLDTTISTPGTEQVFKTQLQNEHPETITRAASVRTRTHKLIVRPNGQSELYDCPRDPGMRENLFGESSVAPVQAALEARLLNWYINTSGIAPMDKDGRDPPPYYPTPSFEVNERALLDH